MVAWCRWWPGADGGLRTWIACGRGWGGWLCGRVPGQYCSITMPGPGVARAVAGCMASFCADGHWQLDMEGRAFAWDAAAGNPDGAVHGLHQTARDIEAEAGAAYRAVDIAFQPHKTLEQPGLILRRNTLTFVRNTDDDRRHIGVLHIHLHMRRIADGGMHGRVFQRVGANIHQNLAQASGISLHKQPWRNMYLQVTSLLLHLRLDQRHHTLNHLL